MAELDPAARELLESDALVHLVTINPDGSPQVSIVWAGLDGDEIVTGHLPLHRKLRNVQRDPRVSLSIEGPGLNPIGLREYLVVHGTARIDQGGDPSGFVDAIPAGRYGDPQEIGMFAAWILAEAPAFPTGAELPLDGGMTTG